MKLIVGRVSNTMKFLIENDVFEKVRDEIKNSIQKKKKKLSSLNYKPTA